MDTSQSKIRIVHCIGSMRVGGAEGQLAELICRLPRERFEQSLVLLRGEGPLIEKVKAAGCPVIDLNYERKFNPLSPAWHWAIGQALGRYLRHLRDRRPHILHAQLYWANILSALAGSLARVPAVVTARRQLSVHKQGRPLMQKLENWANRHTDAVLVNSDAVRRDTLEHEQIDPAKVHRIHNGVVLERFETPDPGPLRRELGLEPGQVVIMAVANLHRYKGHDDLLRALARLRPAYPNLRAVFPGRDQGMGETLRALTAELGLDGVVQFLGERRDIPALLAVADIVVHPSHEEGFSNSILEAMTAGRPLVVSDVGGCPEQVRDGVNGFVVPPRSPEALAEALGRLLGDAELRRTMGAASRRRIEEEFSMERTVREYIEFYETLYQRAVARGVK